MQHLGDRIPRFGKGKDVFETVEIRRLWPEIVGDYLAEKTFVKKLYFKKLIVSVEHGGWAHQLNMMKADILTKLRKKTKIDIDDIQWNQEQLETMSASADRKTIRNKFQRREPTSDASLQDIMSRVRSLHKDLQK